MFFFFVHNDRWRGDFILADQANFLLLVSTVNYLNTAMSIVFSNSIKKLLRKIHVSRILFLTFRFLSPIVYFLYERNIIPYIVPNISCHHTNFY